MHVTYTLLYPLYNNSGSGSSKETTSKKKGSTSKKRRANDDDDLDWSPNPREDIDEEDENDDGEIDVSNYKGKFEKWDMDSYARKRSLDQYDQENDATIPFFYTKVQHDAFFGYIINATVHKHQYINM
jgi:hypothetical protein